MRPLNEIQVQDLFNKCQYVVIKYSTKMYIFHQFLLYNYILLPYLIKLLNSANSYRSNYSYVCEQGSLLSTVSLPLCLVFTPLVYLRHMRVSFSCVHVCVCVYTFDPYVPIFDYLDVWLRCCAESQETLMPTPVKVKQLLLLLVLCAHAS